jgi:hypothetical protein
MKQSIRILTMSALVLASAAFTTRAEEEIKGRDIVTKGAVQTLSGTLKAEGHEWELIAADGTAYELHLGPTEYRESKSFTMKDGEHAEVRGFVFNTHVSPISLKTQSASIELRTEAGKPAWANSSFSNQRSQKDQ